MGSKWVECVWDTGSAHTLVSPRLVQRLEDEGIDLERTPPRIKELVVADGRSTPLEAHVWIPTTWGDPEGTVRRIVMGAHVLSTLGVEAGDPRRGIRVNKNKSVHARYVS